MKIINCPVCGKRISDNLNYCPDCGTDLSEFHDNNITKRNSKRIVIISFIVVICICIIILILLISKSFKTPGNTNTNKIDNDEYTTDNIISDETIPETPHSNINASTSNKESSSDTPIGNNSSTPVGVYNGDDHEILVINENGLADYYCISDEFIELSVPWKYENNYVEIKLEKLHCTIKANIVQDNFEELLFKSDSENWNAELFTRINANPEDYENKKVNSLDDNVSINRDGSLNINISNYTFSAPKKYWTTENEFSNNEDIAIIIDSNADYDFSSAIMFYREKLSDNLDYNDLAKEFINRFMSKPSCKKDNSSDKKIDCHIYNIQGTLNNGFSGMKGYNSNGKLAILPDDDSLIYILFIQTADRDIDNTEDFENIISSKK